jgi:hypothetical protein
MDDIQKITGILRLKIVVVVKKQRQGQAER